MAKVDYLPRDDDRVGLEASTLRGRAWVARRANAATRNPSALPGSSRSDSGGSDIMKPRIASLGRSVADWSTILAGRANPKWA